MEIFYIIVVFVFGLIFGSFYNVVGFRLPINMSLMKPGSACPKCKHNLKWYENIPLLSFIIQGGKCRGCKCKISFFYPFTEFLTGMLFALSYFLFGFSYEFVLSICIVSFLMIVIVSDINYLIIPDEVTVFFSVITTIVIFFAYGYEEMLYSLGSGVLMFTIMYMIMFLGNKLFGKESLGGGDVKLMFFIGLLVRPPEGLLVIFISSLLALPISLVLLWRKKTNVVAFGPFILVALVIVFWFKLNLLDVMDVLTNFFGR